MTETTLQDAQKSIDDLFNLALKALDDIVSAANRANALIVAHKTLNDGAMPTPVTTAAQKP